MIIQPQSRGIVNKTRQMSLDSMQSSESEEGSNQVTYYISSVETTAENLAGEEVVSIKNEDVICDVRCQKTDARIPNAMTNEVELAVLCLQAQGSTHNFNPLTLTNANIITDASLKRRVFVPEEIATKRKKLGEDKKITVVYPVKTDIKNISGIQNNVSISSLNSNKATYKCPTCNLTFDTDKYLSMHMSTHNSKQSFDQSNQQASINSTIKTTNKLSSSLIQTDNCQSQLLANAANSSTDANSPPTGEWTCPYCSKMFYQNSGFKNHVRTHSDERPFVCDICVIGFKERYHLKKHYLFKHTNDLKETCRTCGKRFKDSTAVRAHERIHSEARPYGCPLCGKTFKTSECLWHHENRSKTCGKAISGKQTKQNGLIKLPGRQAIPTLINSPQKKQRRSKLSASLEAKGQRKNSDCFISENSLDVTLMDSINIDESILEGIFAQLNEVGGFQNLGHGLVKAATDFEYNPPVLNGPSASNKDASSELRPYECKLCDKKFKLKVHLKKHNLYRHSTEYPCECSICGKKFKDTSAVKLHEKIHSNERPFECGCGKSFKTRENLWGHRNRGPCDSRTGNQSVVDSGSNGKGLPRGRTKSLKGQTTINVQTNGFATRGDQNLNNLVKIELIEGISQLPNLKIHSHEQSQNVPVPLISSTNNLEIPLGHSTNAVLKPSLKMMKTPQENNQPITNSGDIETSLSFHSSLPTAVVAPIRRPQQNSNFKNVSAAGSHLTQGHFLPKDITVLTAEALRCPTIHSLLLSKGNKIVQSSTMSNNVSNSMREQSRVLKLYNAPTDTLAILIPTDSSQQISMLDINAAIRGNAKQEQQRIPTLNTLMIRDFNSNANQDVQTNLANSNTDIDDIFDFGVGDHDLMDFAFNQNCGPLPCNLEDLGQTMDPHSSSLDEMCSWSSDSSWLLGDDVSFLDDMKLPEVAPINFRQ